MSFNILGQKFTGTDLELISFIKNELENEIDKKFLNLFTKKEIAIKVGESIKINLKKEYDDFKTLNLILNSKDTSLTEQKNLIIKNDSIKKVVARIKILNELRNTEKNYIDVLKKLQVYYSLKEYTTLADLKYLSLQPHILVFSHDNIFYTSLVSDDEKELIEFILSSKNFIDYSFNFEETSDKKISDKNLKELIKKETVWKEIYSKLNENTNEEVLVSYSFNLFKETNEHRIKTHNDYDELFSLYKKNIY